MKASDFREWVGKITQLSRGQKEQTKHKLGGMVPRIEVAKWLESSFEPICPVCQSNHFIAGDIRRDYSVSTAACASTRLQLYRALRWLVCDTRING